VACRLLGHTAVSLDKLIIFGVFMVYCGLFIAELLKATMLPY